VPILNLSKKHKLDNINQIKITEPLFNLGVISRPGAARLGRNLMASQQFRPFIGPPSAKAMMRVSDDDGFVRPRTGGSRRWENVVTFESASPVSWLRSPISSELSAGTSATGSEFKSADRGLDYYRKSCFALSPAGHCA
jgi:hypothetical protein